MSKTIGITLRTLLIASGAEAAFALLRLCAVDVPRWCEITACTTLLCCGSLLALDTWRSLGKEEDDD